MKHTIALMIMALVVLSSCTKGVNEEEIALSNKTQEQWQQDLSPQVYHVLWEKGTEPAHSSELLYIEEEGVYVTAGCNIPVFSSEHKYDSGTGWPSFYDTPYKDNLILKEDNILGYTRIEVLSKCGEHLGHVFQDGPEPTGLRYCINGLALEFEAQ